MGLNRRHYTRTGTRRASACQPMTAIGASSWRPAWEERAAWIESDAATTTPDCLQGWLDVQTQWQVTHLPRILLILDDRARIKENVVLSLATWSRLIQTWTAPSELSGPETREREPHRRRGLGLRPHISRQGYLISNRLPVWYKRVLSSLGPGKRTGVTYTYPPPGLLHKPGFTQRALQSTRQPLRPPQPSL